MTDKPFDPSLPVAARHGRPVRIISTDGNARCSIAAWHTDFGGQEHLVEHCPDGSASINKDYDLYNPSEKSVHEVCILPDRYGGVGLLNSRLVPHNVRLAFEGDKLVAVELIGDE